MRVIANYCKCYSCQLFCALRQLFWMLSIIANFIANCCVCYRQLLQVLFLPIVLCIAPIVLDIANYCKFYCQLFCALRQLFWISPIIANFIANCFVYRQLLYKCYPCQLFCESPIIVQVSSLPIILLCLARAAQSYIVCLARAAQSFCLCLARTAQSFCLCLTRTAQSFCVYLTHAGRAFVCD